MIAKKRHSINLFIVLLALSMLMTACPSDLNIDPDIEDSENPDIEDSENPDIGDSENPTVSLLNCTNNGTVQSGFLIGTASDNLALTRIEVSLDSGDYNAASGTANWSFALPAGAMTWKKNSLHFINVRAIDESGNVSDTISIQLKKGKNCDVNGDGYSDIIAGAAYYSNGNPNEGAAFVYNGSASGPGTSAAWSAEGNQTYAYFGASVAFVGDVNGDGYADVLVGANNYENGENYEGGAFLFHGSVSGLSTTADWTGESNQVGAQFGSQVSSAGDVNGDGYDDIIVGAPMYDNGNTDEGMVFVFLGSASGLGATADWTAESNSHSSLFGCAVSSAGDINNDGYADVIIGARSYSNGESNEGAVFVYYGSATGLSISADWSVESNQADANFGFSVSIAGDVNGDNYADVLIGANLFDNGETDEGMAFLYCGSASGLSAIADWNTESNQLDANYGYSVASAGDINGDSFSDVIIGAYAFDNPEINEGMAFIYHGSNSGLSTSPNITIESNLAGAILAKSVSSAGDINNDGYSDIIVGAPSYTNGTTHEGLISIYTGSLSGLDSTAIWNIESNKYLANLGSSVGD